MPLPPRTRLGSHDIVSPLGARGMGEVHRAHDARLRRDVAIKVLPASVTDDPERLRRFEQEALATAALNHPNILSVYDVGVEGDTTFVVAELLEGRTLREAIEYATGIARGLATAHDKGIMAYVSDETGRPEVFVVPFPDVDSGRWQITTDGGMDPRWSRDGQRLLVRGAGGARGTVHEFDLSRGPASPTRTRLFERPARARATPVAI